MALLPFFTNHANVMTHQLLLATFMQTKSVIHQPNLNREKKWRPFVF